MKSMFAAALLVCGATRVFAAGEPATIFANKCSSCHTYGEGDRVGPDLKGATTRHPQAWLRSWIRSSQRMIRAGDRAAVSLFRRYRQQQMPDHPLSDAEIDALIAYLAKGGPDADARPALRAAASATRQDVERGRALFFGDRRLTSGGAACSSCHSVRDQPRLFGGSLAPNLTQAYSKYQDRGLAALLARACFPRTPSLDGRRPVTDDESFVLRAFLRGAETPQAAGTGGEPESIAQTRAPGSQP